MQAVRCDACGMKALVAASQCPHCGHLFELRDSFGELLPLSHCTACNSWYPSQRGACQWCGPQPESFRFPPYAWKGVGILAFVGMGVGVWLTREDDAEPGVVAATARDSATSSAPPPEPVEPDPPVTFAAVPETIAPAPDSILVETVPGPEPAPVATSVIEPPPRVVQPIPPSARKAPVRRPRPQRWTSSVARSWVTLRAAPDRGARIVGSVGPDTRIQLGEARGNWRRIRTRGVAGWAETQRVASREPATR